MPVVTPFATRDPRVTPILHSHTVTRPALSALLVVAAAACASSTAPAPLRATDAGTARDAAKPPETAATHLGRTVLPRADAIVRGRLSETNAAGRGAEVGRLRPTEWLRPADCAYEGDLVVLSAKAGSLPLPGRDALFLLHALPESENFELVDVAPLDDDAGPARIATMKRYLEIEAMPGADERVAALREHLRTAVVSSEEWPRANAAREYAAFADKFRSALETADRAALEQSLRRGADRVTRGFLETALAACPGGGPRPAKPATAGQSPARAAPFLTRYSVPGATAAMRRQAVIDAAAEIGADATPLFERALEDQDAPVRDAAAAAAGQCDVTALAPRLTSMLVTDTSLPVKRSLVMACGHLRAAGAVPALAAIARTTGPLTREAMFALARIRDEPALSELRRLRDEAPEASQREDAAFLLSERFVEQERALRETR